MEQRQFSLCQDTQNQEKYLCLNKECYTSKKKQLHCHECLVKLHKTDKNSIKHYEEFVTFDSIINDLIRRNNKKLELYNQMIIDAHQFKKDKFKELCTLKSFSSKSSEFQNQVFKKIEQYVEESPKQLNSQVSLVRQGLQFQKDKLQFNIEQYLSNDTKFEDSLKQVLEEIKKNIETYIASIELQDSQTIKKKTIQQLQKKIADLEGVKTMPKTDYFPKNITIFIIIIPMFYLIYTIQQLDTQLLKLQMKLDQQSLSILELQKLLIQEVKQSKKEQDNQIETLLKQSHDSLQSNNELKDILINNDSKLVLKVIQLQKKTDEEFNKTKNILQELIYKNPQKLDMELKANVEPITFNEKSEILETDYIINQIIIGQQLNFTKAELIYKSKRDGLTLNAFWLSMKKYGSTLLIAKFHNFHIIGAFTLPPYIPSFYGDYMVDGAKKSFLFSYTKNKIYKLKDDRFTLYSKYMVGPQFGQGPDLSLQGFTFDQCSSNIGYTYEYGYEKGESIIDGSPKIIEMEVFLLS
ncbi:unnamed protein product [Paramecium pentaurelia]|uniref:Oxidation resistance protein 1 n=1 Tax=Paramecium pentaurelia TaxID=43138 RepID=A0A8S1XQU6_9CILI|nr:unnamed protein product [Paramecium pentaurelia]